MKTPVLRLTMFFLVAGLAFAGCNQGAPGGGIPIDREQAKRHIISEQQARNLIGRFKEARLKNTDTALLAGMPDAELFNRHAIALLLNQEGAEGVRIYIGHDEKGQVRLVLLPVDKNGKNIVRNLLGSTTASIPGVKSAKAFDEDGPALENGQRCPHDCDEGW